jgi:hypothetical protein
VVGQRAISRNRLYPNGAKQKAFCCLLTRFFVKVRALHVPAAAFQPVKDLELNGDVAAQCIGGHTHG